MHRNGWFSVRTNAKALYEYSKLRKKNIISQNCKTDKPNQIWVSDITYFNYKERKFYICVIIDLYSRKVVAFKISKRNSTQLTKATFKSAYLSRNPQEGLIFHLDNGSNYISRSFCLYLKELGVVQSFSRSGKPHDNAVCEAFFRCMKSEELYRYKYKSEREFRKRFQVMWSTTTHKGRIHIWDICRRINTSVCTPKTRTKQVRISNILLFDY